MSVNTTIVEFSASMPTIEAMSQQWNAVQTEIPDIEGHGQTILQHWDEMVALIGDPGKEYAIDGESLNLATVVAVAR